MYDVVVAISHKVAVNRSETSGTSDKLKSRIDRKEDQIKSVVMYQQIDNEGVCRVLKVDRNRTLTMEIVSRELKKEGGWILAGR